MKKIKLKALKKLFALVLSIIMVNSFVNAVYACDYCPAFSFSQKQCSQTSDESQAAVFVAWVEAEPYAMDPTRFQYANAGAGIYLNEEEGHEIQDPGFERGYLEVYLYQNDNLTNAYASYEDYIDLGSSAEIYAGSTEFYYSDDMYKLSCEASFYADCVYSPYIINTFSITAGQN